MADEIAALRAAIRNALGLPPEGTQIDVVDADAFLGAAAFHSIPSLVAAGLDSSDLLGVPARLRAELAAHARRVAMRNLQLASACDQLAQRAAGVGIRVVVLKGLALAVTAYPALGLRDMVDVDLLVERPRVRETLDVLRTMGFAAARAFDLDADMAIAHHATAFVKDRCSIEVHWDLADPSWPIGVAVEAVWQRVVEMPLGRAQLWRLCDEDMLVHVCFHAVSGHDLAIGIRPVVDVAALLTKPGRSLDWGLLREISINAGAARAVSLLLALTGRMLGVPVAPVAYPEPCPDDVVDVAEEVVWRGAHPARLKTSLARMHADAGLSERVAYAFGRVFISRADLAKSYGVSRTACYLPLLYARRVIDLFRQHAPAIARSDQVARVDAEQRGTVRKWVFPGGRPPL